MGGETCEGFNEATGSPFPSCETGLVCMPTSQAFIPGAQNTCVMADFNEIQTMTWTMDGPWDMKTIEGEKKVLKRIFSRTLGLPTRSTQVSVYRNNGIVEIAFTVTGTKLALQPLSDPMFKALFQQNIAHDKKNADIGDDLFLNGGDVMAFYVLDGAWDKNAVSDHEDMLTSLFSQTLMMPADQIETEVTTEHKMTRIIYKAKATNPMQLMPLYNGANFTEAYRANSAYFPELSQILGIVSCPVDPPLGGLPCQGTMRCEYGVECCCGECYPSFVAECGQDGLWTNLYTDACLDGPSRCPQLGLGSRLKSIYPGSEEDDSEGPQEGDRLTLAVITVLCAILGVCVGCFAVRMCGSNEKPTFAGQTNDLYRDISLDADVARTV